MIKQGEKFMLGARFLFLGSILVTLIRQFIRGEKHHNIICHKSLLGNVYEQL